MRTIGHSYCYSVVVLIFIDNTPYSCVPMSSVSLVLSVGFLWEGSVEAWWLAGRPALFAVLVSLYSISGDFVGWAEATALDPGATGTSSFLYVFV